MALIPAILDYISSNENRKVEAEKVAAQAELWKMEKEKIKLATEQQNMMLAAIKTLPPDLQSAAILDPKFAGHLMYLSNFAFGGQNQPKEPPQTFESTGQAIFPREDQIPKTLPNQIAQGQMGGLTPQSLLLGAITKEYGMPSPAEALRERKIFDQKSGKWITVMMNKYGQPLPGTEGPIPPDWKETEVATPAGKFQVLRNMVTGEVDWSTATQKAPEGAYKTTVGGPTGQQEIWVPNPVIGQQPPSIPTPVRPEKVTVTGPRGEQIEQFVNPMLQVGGGQGGVAVPGGIQVKPPQPTSVPVAQQTTMVKSGLEALQKIKDAMFDPKTGEINRKNLANAMVGTPWTEGKRMGDLAMTALNAIRMASTGAAFTKAELDQLIRQYVPGFKDNDQQVYEKWELMGKFLESMLNQMDPNEVYTKDVRSQFGSLMSIPRSEGTSERTLPKRVTMEHEGSRFIIPEDKIKSFMDLYPDAKRVK